MAPSLPTQPPQDDLPSDVSGAPSLAGIRPPSWGHGVAVALALIAILGTFVAHQYQPNTYLHRDGSFYATVNRTLLDGQLDQRGAQPASWYESDLAWNEDVDQAWSNISVGRDGTWYPKHPVLLPLITTPAFWAFGPAGLLVMNVALLLGFLWLSWRLACRFARPSAATVAILSLAPLPLITDLSYAYSNDVLYGCLVVGALEASLRRRFAGAGVLFGLAIWAKPITAVFGLPVGLYLLYTKRRREAAVLACATAVPVLAWLSLNAWRYGSPFTTSYDRILTRVGGEQTLASVREAFNRPWGRGLLSLLVRRDEGLWWNAPSLVVGLAGLPWLWKRARWAGQLAVAWFVVWALFYARYDYQYVRFFLPWAGVMVVPLAVLLDEGSRRLNAFDAAQQRRTRRVLAGFAGLVLTAALITGVLRNQPSSPWRAVDHVDAATVELLPNTLIVPCDYFNPSHERFECTSYEPEPWRFWGRALGGECRLAGQRQDWLWLHPAPGAGKRITFRNVPPGDVIVRYGLTTRSKGGPVRAVLRSGPTALAQLETADAGTISVTRVPASLRTGTSLTLAVPRQMSDWRQLCADLSVEAPGAPP